MADYLGLWIPVPILLNSELNLTEKMLLAAVLPLTFSHPCNASNEYLSGLLGVDPQTVSNNLNSLHSKGYLRIYIDRRAGNRRLIHSYVFGNDLYKYVGEPIQKDSTPLYNNFIELYNNFIEPIQNCYIPSIKSLYTLYKNFVFVYNDERKEERKEESTVNDVGVEKKIFLNGLPKEEKEKQSPPIAPPPPYNWNTLHDILAKDAPFMEWGQRELKIDTAALVDLILDYIIFQHGKGRPINTDYTDLKSHIINYGRKKLEAQNNGNTNTKTNNGKRGLRPSGVEPPASGRRFGSWDD